MYLIFCLCRTQFESPPINNLAALSDVFSKYGPSPRQCFLLTRDEKERRNWENGIPVLLKGVVQSNSLHTIVTGLFDNFPPQLFLVKPDDDRTPKLTIISRHVAEHLFNAMEKNNSEKFWDIFNLFWIVPESRSAAGWLFEPHALSVMLSGEVREFDLKNLSGSGSKASKASSISLPFDPPSSYGDVESLSDILRRTLPSQIPRLFKPASKSAATFDAFSVSHDEIILFQHTVGNSHRISLVGLDLL
jgi:hypothetical protein